MAGVPGTDLRSIPDSSAIGALYDMDAVDASGGEASDVQLDTETPEDDSGSAELSALVDQIGVDVAIKALSAVAANPQILEMISQGGAPSAPQDPAQGSQGALSAMM